MCQPPISGKTPVFPGRHVHVRSPPRTALLLFESSISLQKSSLLFPCRLSLAIQTHQTHIVLSREVASMTIHRRAGLEYSSILDSLSRFYPIISCFVQFRIRTFEQSSIIPCGFPVRPATPIRITSLSAAFPFPPTPIPFAFDSSVMPHYPSRHHPPFQAFLSAVPTTP